MSEPKGEVLSGSCLCGAVTFEVRPPTKWCAHCHCSMCRRAHGAPFVTWVGAFAASFRIVDGLDLLQRYQSSPGARRSFCRACGSPLFFEGDRWPGKIHIARAAMAGAIDRLPQAHCFFSDRADWLSIADDLPKRGGPSGLDPLP